MTKNSWKRMVAGYLKPALHRSLWQVIDSVVPYLVLWGLMAWTIRFSYLLTLALAFPAAGFLVRVFIIFHDCGHGSFFRSRRANHTLGFITGVLTFTPYLQWRRQHAMHHASAADLDRRGTGDIWTLTVQEYLESSRWKRFAYRLARNPFVLFVVAPAYMFLINQRIPSREVRRRDRLGVHWTNLTILAIAAMMSLLVGIKAYLLIQGAIMVIAGAAGIWLFYVQHQFEGVYWERHEDWDFEKAALEGSSFYRLPRILQWFSGNIGFHHIHHLSPRIPNYNLERCHRAVPRFQQVKQITLWSSLKSMSLRLWDEQSGKLVGYGRLRAIRREKAGAGIG